MACLKYLKKPMDEKVFFCLVGKVFSRQFLGNIHKSPGMKKMLFCLIGKVFSG
jgi:hypothetical protein